MSAAPPSPIRVAIVGATGNVGQAITHALMQYDKQKVTVTLLLRALPADAPAAKRTSRDELVSQGARVVDIDVESASADELAAALAHTDVLLSVVGVSLLKDGQLKLVAASKQAGVRRILPSEFGFDMAQVGRGSTVPPWDFKLDVQEAIQQSGLEYTFIEAGLFGEYLLPFAGIDTASRILTAPGSFDTRVSISPLADVGKQVADLIVTGRGRNETVFLGTVNYSWSDLHTALERVTGAHWRKVVKSAAEYAEDADKNQNDWVARVSPLIMAGKGAHFPPSDTYAHKHSIALGDFDAFLRKLVAAKSK